MEHQRWSSVGHVWKGICRTGLAIQYFLSSGGRSRTTQRIQGEEQHRTSLYQNLYSFYSLLFFKAYAPSRILSVHPSQQINCKAWSPSGAAVLDAGPLNNPAFFKGAGGQEDVQGGWGTIVGIFSTCTRKDTWREAQQMFFSTYIKVLSDLEGQEKQNSSCMPIVQLYMMYLKILETNNIE